ncbi:sugar ABC transporter substrate-binding protein [Anaerosacchariphilus polymeriproducens]|uniref:Maltose ABC transporter substrate-binding protein n=1 Tax=Anaerosacchariphilus polymeriproducens TaxID=1812858 RepID=A0A371AX92_9FIRM|nr:maltose ABC transporter substrate-binding protein [Anaerosacchariphilus polymeriproducens]RDU24169.1 maltose ABC transporter substrate-binding protein [Anaerosacchariphilus polymeriproducens]
MKSKKIICKLMVGIMIVGVLTGCGKKVIPTEATKVQEDTKELKAEEGAKLLFWAKPGELEYGKAVAESFQKEYGVKVTVQESGLDAVNKMMLDGPSGNGADIFMAAHDTFSTAHDAGLLLELNNSVTEKIKEQVNETAVKSVEKAGKLYGVPVSVETYGLLYNKNLVKDEPAETMEQIVEEAKAYNNPGENKFWYLTAVSDGFAAYPFLSLDGFSVFGKNGTDNDNPGFKTPEFEKGLENISALKEIIPIKAEDLKMETASQLEQNFKEGKTAYYPSGPWLVKTLKEDNIDFGVTTLPTWGGKQMKSFASIQNAYVSAYTDYPKAAQLFASYLISEEAASLLYEKVYKITSRKDISNVSGLKDDEQLRVFAEAFKDAVPMPAVKRMSYYWTVIQGVINPVFEQKMTPTEGARKAQKDFDALVESE